MRRFTEARAIARVWLQNFWQNRARARELARQYETFYEACPLVVADLSRYCLAHDTTHVQGDPEQSQINVGRRDVWLHIKEMLGLDDEDVQHLKEETERDG
jgi:hypothetical protein